MKSIKPKPRKNPKTFLVHRIEPGCSPIDRMQSGPSTGWRQEGVRKIDRCNIFFIGAEPRVVNHEIDQAETEKKTQNIPGSPDRTRMQSNRMQSGPSTGWRQEGVRKIDRCNIFFIGAEPRVMNHEIDQAETEKKPKTFLVHRIEPGCSPIDRMQSGPSTGWSPEDVRKIDRCNFFFIGAEPRVMNHEIDQAETEKKPKTFLVHRIEPGCSRGCSPDHRPDGVEGVRKIDRCNFFFIGAELVNHEIELRAAR